MNRVIDGQRELAAVSSDGASCSSCTAGPDSAISSDSAGVSSGATGASASSVGLARRSAVCSVPSVVRSSLRNGGSEFTVAVRAALRAAVVENTCSPAVIRL